MYGQKTRILSNLTTQFNLKNTIYHLSLPVSGGDYIVYRGWGWVSGGAEWLAQTVGPSMGEHEPVSDVELR